MTATAPEPDTGLHVTSDIEVRDHIPRLTVTAKVEVSGEWVTPDMVSHAARSLAGTLAGRLRAAADEMPTTVEEGGPS